MSSVMSTPQTRLGLPQDSFDLLARRVRGRFLQSAFARTAQEDQRVLDYRRADPQFVNPQSVKQDPKVKFAYVWQALRKKRGFLWEQLRHNRSWREFDGIDPESVPYGPHVTSLVENNLCLPGYHLYENNDYVLDRGLDMGLKYGLNWIHAYWDNDPEWWGVRYENTRWEDVFCDWAGNRWYVIRSFEPVYKVLERAKTWIELPVIDPITGKEIEGGAERIAKNAKLLVEEVKRGTASTHRYDQWYSVDYNRHQRDTGRVTDDDEYGDSRWVAQEDDPLLVRVPRLTFIELRKGGHTATVIPSYGGVPGGDLLFASGFAPYRYCPLVPFVPFPVDEEVYGHSLPYIVGPMDEAMSWALRAQLRFFARWSDPALLYKEGVKLGRRDLDVLANRRIQVQDKDDITILDAPVANTGMHQMALQLTKGLADEMIAESPERRGLASEATATAVNRAGVASNLDDGLVARAAMFSLSQLARVTLEIFRVHMTKERIVAMAGLDGGMEILKLSPEHVKGSYNLRVKGELVAGDPDLKAAWLAEASVRYGPAVIDPMKGFLAEARLKGFSNPEHVLTMRMAPKPKEPIDEHREMFVHGRGVMPSPRENLIQHLNEHVYFQSEVSRRVPPEHPIHQLLQEHIEATEQLRMMMMPSEGGGGGGTPARAPEEEAPFGGAGNVQGSEGANGVQRKRVAGGERGSQTPYAPGRPAAVTAGA